MADISSLAPAKIFLDNPQSRINQSECSTAVQELKKEELIHSFPISRSNQIFSQNYVSSSVGTPQLATAINIRRAAENFIINSSNGPPISSFYNFDTSKTKESKELDVFGDKSDDTELTACILDNLPTSYDDFESKELHLKLERNISSPRIACQTPNTDSGRVSAGSSFTKSSNMHSDSFNSPLDADDLEVAMINELFEEQQRQNRLYGNPGLKSLFYSQPNLPEDRFILKTLEPNTNFRSSFDIISAQEARNSDSSEHVSFKNLFPTAAHGNLVTADESNIFNSAVLPSSSLIPFFKAQTCTETEVLPKQHNSKRSVEVLSFSPISSQINVWRETFRNSLITQGGTNRSLSDKELECPKVLSSSLTDEKMDATEALAVDIVESLFDNNLRESLPVNDERPLESPKAMAAVMSIEGKGALEKEKLQADDTAVDSWEELDNDESSSKIADQLEKAMRKIKINELKTKPFVRNSPEHYNKEDLPHVLEAYGYPTSFTFMDVKQELARYDCADVQLHSVDETHCLVVFSAADAALKALVTVPQRNGAANIRLRALCNASPITQEKARNCRPLLRPHKPRPQTTAIVARRLVEGALGKHSDVSAEQICIERRKLQNAKDSKKARAAIWKDGP